ncbi:hypothetical protein TNCV_1298921 [Trichonephila clavipes]|nr:hypothetical protein TNCV_1298921 [Trichonephila clavipes]
MYKAVKHNGEGKLLSDIDVSEKAREMSKTINALDVYKLFAPLKTSKHFLRWHEEAGSKEFGVCHRSMYLMAGKAVFLRGLLVQSEE